MALAFIEPEKVYTYFDELMASEFFKNAYEDFTDELTKALNELLVYFEKTWVRIYGRNGRVKDGRFLIHLWNVRAHVLNDHHKTNNLCEGFNNGFNSILQAAIPTLWKFIDDLKLQHQFSMKGIADFTSGISVPPKKKVKYADKNERMKTLLLRSSEGLTPVQILLSIASCV